LELHLLTGEGLRNKLDAIARLRSSAMQNFPWFKDTSVMAERSYLSALLDGEGAAAAAAMRGDDLLGVLTAGPLVLQPLDLRTRFMAAGFKATDIYFLDQAAVLPRFWAQNIGVRFLRLQEERARLFKFRYLAQCTICRPDAPPHEAQKITATEDFWNSQGFVEQAAMAHQQSWRDIGDASATPKQIKVWLRDLH
jgi:GNAT superfamily N-acetyltransferase